MVFARGSLARAMREIVRDPEVVGLTSYFENARDPAASLPDGVHFVGPDTRPLFAFQSFDYLRAFFSTRIGWARLNFMLCAAGAFQIWRRDLVEDLRGWSRTFTCEDIEFTFRVHQVLRQRGDRTASRACPDCVGVTEGPDSMRKLVSQRERWQRVILETWWANRRMLLNPRYGTVGMLGMPFYLLSEILAPLFEILAVVDARRRGGGGARRLVGVRRPHARDHVRQQRAHDRRAAHAGPGGADVPPLARRCASSR